MKSGAGLTSGAATIAVKMSDGSLFKNGNGNGTKQKAIAGIVGVVAAALLLWNFGAVYSLQLAAGARDDKVQTLREDFNAQRSADLAFQARLQSQIDAAQSEARNGVQQAQKEMRESTSKMLEILNDFRYQVAGKIGNNGHK